MKVKVEKISQNKSSYRTPLNEIDGMPNPPEIGKSLLLSSSTFGSGGIITSFVTEIVEKDNVIEVKTLNSTYIITKFRVQ